ncbi:hypothetical protein MHU86_11368 [Fragilaria crotonensis]|nr:hypothetical protein MHU86_16531 [Fragilaria crotonensis]KAI2503097.1 hypothetical protein MHU86_11368 [Fragilaria crotonensis]
MSIKNYYQSIALNNEGCGYLEYGELATARDCFRKALQFMTVAIVEAQSENGVEQHVFDTGERHSFIQWSALPHIPLHLPGDSFLYQRAVLINNDFERIREVEPSVFELSEESSMIVYNIGLSYHLLAISRNQTRLLDEAMGFYKIAEGIRSRRPQPRMPELLDLAIYNNMGNVEHEMVNYEQARTYFRVLREALIIFCREGFVTFIAEQDSNGFVLNASMQDVTLAAAA